MAHNINFNERTGKHSFFSVKEKAWHSLGKIVEDYPTSAEAVRYAGLDYTVEKRGLMTFDGLNGRPEDQHGQQIPKIQVPDFYATVRTDTDDVLGVVGKDYQVVQNVEAFSFFDAIVGGNDGILYETAGALGKGECIFITAKLPDYIRVGRDDLIEQYLFLTTSHDGYGSITAAFTPIRICCNNTLNAALRRFSNGIKIRHTANAAERLRQAHMLMGISNMLSEEMEDIFNRWARVRITDIQVKRLIERALTPSKEVFEKLQSGHEEELSTRFAGTVNDALEYAFASPTQQGRTTRGTLFGAYNAVTGYFQNVRSYKDEENKFKSIMQGTGRLRSQAAFNLCQEFEKKGGQVLN